MQVLNKKSIFLWPFGFSLKETVIREVNIANLPFSAVAGVFGSNLEYHTRNLSLLNRLGSG